MSARSADGRGRRRGELALQDLDLAAGVRQRPGERLVEHDAERVPIARVARRLAEPDLGRHVDRRARERARAGRALVDGEPEVEEHDTTGRLDERVRRLEIAMQTARAV